MLPFYRKLLPKYRILVYSGDTDAVVNGLGTQASIDKLGLKVIDDWKVWNVDSAQGRVVGGFIRKHESNLTFITIRGAGTLLTDFANFSRTHGTIGETRSCFGILIKVLRKSSINCFVFVIFNIPVLHSFIKILFDYKYSRSSTIYHNNMSVIIHT